MNLTKWAFETAGNSSFFRDSKLWQIISPLAYSALEPEKQPKETEALVTAVKSKEINEKQIDAGVITLPIDEIIDTEDLETNIEADAYSEVKNDEEIIAQFDNTAIDYQVFFLE